jgi:hypothetical protein
MRWPFVVLAGGVAIAAPKEVTVLTKEAEVDGAVGKTVTLRGVLQRSKIPTVLGVDVAEVSALAGKTVLVTGRLERFTIEPPAKDEPLMATRGPGVYYRLVDESGKLSTPRRD